MSISAVRLRFIQNCVFGKRLVFVARLELIKLISISMSMSSARIQLLLTKRRTKNLQIRFSALVTRASIQDKLEQKLKPSVQWIKPTKGIIFPEESNFTFTNPRLFHNPILFEFHSALRLVISEMETFKLELRQSSYRTIDSQTMFNFRRLDPFLPVHPAILPSRLTWSVRHQSTCMYLLGT